MPHWLPIHFSSQPSVFSSSCHNAPRAIFCIRDWHISLFWTIKVELLTYRVNEDNYEDEKINKWHIKIIGKLLHFVHSGCTTWLCRAERHLREDLFRRKPWWVSSTQMVWGKWLQWIICVQYSNCRGVHVSKLCWWSVIRHSPAFHDFKFIIVSLSFRHNYFNRNFVIAKIQFATAILGPLASP